MKAFESPAEYSGKRVPHFVQYFVLAESNVKWNLYDHEIPVLGDAFASVIEREANTTELTPGECGEQRLCQVHVECQHPDTHLWGEMKFTLVN